MKFKICILAASIGFALLGCQSEWDKPAKLPGRGSIGVYARKPAPRDMTERAEMSVLGYNPNKIEVTRVAPGGPGDKAGIRQGDLILGIANSDTFLTSHEAMQSLRLKQPGETVSLRIERGGKEIVVKSEVCDVRNIAAPDVPEAAPLDKRDHSASQESTDQKSEEQL